MTAEQLSDFEIRIRKTQHGYKVTGTYHNLTISQDISDLSELEPVVTQIREEIVQHE